MGPGSKRSAHIGSPTPTMAMPTPSCGKKGDPRSTTERKRRRVKLLTEALARRQRVADELTVAATAAAKPPYDDKKTRIEHRIYLNAAVMKIEWSLLQQTQKELKWAQDSEFPPRNQDGPCV
jgi:hypothetical protein